MQQLTTREDQIMQIVWKNEKVFIREIIEHLPEPKPHYNTIATIVKILVRKKFLKSELIGNVHQYYPAVSFEAYREKDLRGIRTKYFGNSIQKMFIHFARKEQFTDAEKEELINIIKSKKR